MPAPRMRCRKAIDFDLDDAVARHNAFRNAEYAHFQQGWRHASETAFRPAKAAAVWTSNAIAVHADLSDDDIFNDVPTSDFNRMAIGFGDVFEIFLKPLEQDSYFEFHISPNNQLFQLRIPKPGALQNMRQLFNSEEDMLEKFKIKSSLVESRVFIDRKACRWQVYACIPFSPLAERAAVKAGTIWRFSFSRYDYTRPSKEPVYSSTSPHSKINYHLVDEYGFLEFCKG